MCTDKALKKIKIKIQGTKANMIQLFIYIFKRKKYQNSTQTDFETFNLVSHSWGAQY